MRWLADGAVGPLQHYGLVLPIAELYSRTQQGRLDLPPVVLLHGSGQDENTLVPLAEVACPGHTVTAVRGRIRWEAGYAFFRRLPDRTLDEADLAMGVAAIQRLLVRLQEEGHRPPILLGYSNGAIAAAAAAVEEHRLSAGAILLRPLSPQPARAFPRLDGFPVLLVSGEDDARRDPSDGPHLGRQFEAAGAATTLVSLPVGHGLAAADADTVSGWLRNQRGRSDAS